MIKKCKNYQKKSELPTNKQKSSSQQSVQTSLGLSINLREFDYLDIARKYIFFSFIIALV